MTGPTIVSAASGVAHLQVGCVAPQPVDHLLVHAAVDDRPSRRGADLPAVERPDAADRRHRRGHVGVVEHDASALAAELEQQPLHRRAAGTEDLLTDRRRAGEADHVDVARLGQRRRRFGPRRRDDVDDAGREADVVHDLGELDDGERVLRRRLHHDRAADRERGSDLAGLVHEREVVGRDAGDRADGGPVDDGAHQAAGRQRRGRHRRRRQRDPEILGRVAGVALEAIDGDGHLHPRSHHRRRPGLGDDQRHQVGLPLAEPVGDGEQQPSPLLLRRAAPGGERLLRGASGRLRLFDRCFRGLADDLLGGGVRHVAGAAVAVDPVAADQEAVMLHRCPFRRHASPGEPDGRAGYNLTLRQIPMTVQPPGGRNAR